MKISDIDPNFKVETTLPYTDVCYRNCEEAPFQIYGIFKENGKFRRMPEDVAKSVSEIVYALHANTAGGRIRFQTDREYVAILAKMPAVGKMPHFAFTGSIGFDLYVKMDGMETYYNSFIPPFDIKDGFESHVVFPDRSMREITINFPLYSDVSDLYIGLQETAALLPATPYKYTLPVVYYGSSITQGGCASRPGSSYQAILSRELDTDYRNLGFSGGAKAEDTIIEYIKNQQMSVFVYDYDHNAPTVEHLRDTHEKMFRAIRAAQPELPIIMMSRPRYYLNDEAKARLEIIKTTYQNAVNRGDKNVYLIDGPTLMAIAQNEGTVDNCHPNDLGFYSMAKAVAPVLKKLL